MAKDVHVALLKQGVAVWNAWRAKDPSVRPDLSRASLSNAHLEGANLRWANLSDADLSGALLRGANLTDADLNGALLRGADLTGADLRFAHLEVSDLCGATLVQANLSWACLGRANLRAAYLSGANLSMANLVEADLINAHLSGCNIYGVSAWNVKLNEPTKWEKGTEQQNLTITAEGEPEVTVDNIEVAQFVYLLLHNEKIRDVIDTIGKKGVLLLGRFTEGRIQILERLREKLRSLGYVPMVFNFDKPETKDFTETVRLLANLSHFVIADITNPRSTPLELQATVPDTMVPFAPILQDGEEPFSMFADLNKYHWMLKPIIEYSSVDRLLEVLEDEIIKPAETKFIELLADRTKEIRRKKV